MTGERTLPGQSMKAGWTPGTGGWAADMDANLFKASVLMQLCVESTTDVVPASPADGYMTIVPETDATNPKKIAVRDAGAWVYVTPKTGMTAFVKDTAVHVYFTAAGNWKKLPYGAYVLADLTDVDDTTPLGGQGLVWDGDSWGPGIPQIKVAQLADVVTTDLANGQVLVWNALSQKWIAGTVAGGGGGGASAMDDLTDVDVSTIAPRRGQTLVYDEATDVWLPGGGVPALPAQTITLPIVNGNFETGDFTGWTAIKTEDATGNPAGAAWTMDTATPIAGTNSAQHSGNNATIGGAYLMQVIDLRPLFHMDYVDLGRVVVNAVAKVMGSNADCNELQFDFLDATDTVISSVVERVNGTDNVTKDIGVAGVCPVGTRKVKILARNRNLGGTTCYGKWDSFVGAIKLAFLPATNANELTPVGGSAGQVIVKQSNTDRDVAWADRADKIVTTAGAHSYWRVRYLTGNHASFLSAFDIQFRQKAGVTEHPAGGTVLEMQTRGGFLASAAFDADDTTRWALDDIANIGVAYLGYHYASPVEVAEVAMLVTNGETPKDYNVDYSDDGLGWLTALQVRNQTVWDATRKLHAMPTKTVKGFGPGALTALSDVDLSTAPSDKQYLVFDAVAGKWKAGGGKNAHYNPYLIVGSLMTTYDFENGVWPPVGPVALVADLTPSIVADTDGASAKSLRFAAIGNGGSTQISFTAFADATNKTLKVRYRANCQIAGDNFILLVDGVEVARQSGFRERHGLYRGPHAGSAYGRPEIRQGWLDDDWRRHGVYFVSANPERQCAHGSVSSRRHGRLWRQDLFLLERHDDDSARRGLAVARHGFGAGRSYGRRHDGRGRRDGSHLRSRDVEVEAESVDRRFRLGRDESDSALRNGGLRAAARFVVRHVQQKCRLHDDAHGQVHEGPESHDDGRNGWRSGRARHALCRRLGDGLESPHALCRRGACAHVPDYRSRDVREQHG
jgi:hypothetical protein